MGLGSAKAHILGHEQEFFTTIEDTNGYHAEPKTADSMNVLTTSFAPDRPRKDRTDAYKAYRGVKERITGQTENSWGVEAHYVPSGTKNVAPDCGELIKCAMGAEAVNANDVTYSLLSTQALDTLTLTRFFQDLFMECMVGAWVETMTISFAGGEEPKIKFDGGAMAYAATGYSITTDNPLAAASTTVNVTTGEGSSFHDPLSSAVYARSVVDVGTSAPTGTMTAQADNGASGTTCTDAAHGLVEGQVVTITGTTNYNGTYNIFNVTTDTFDIDDAFVADESTGTWATLGHIVTDRATDALTIAPPTSAEQAVGTTVAPVAPTHTDAGSPMTGIAGSLTWDSLAFAVTSFELTLKNNIKALSHAFKPHKDDAIPGFREVTGKFTAMLRQDFIKKLLARQDFGAKTLAVVGGGAAQSGTRVEIDASYCELNYGEVSIPEAEEASVDFTFKLLESSGNDEFTFKHT